MSLSTPDRQARLAHAAEGSFDVVVVGGGITGAGVALDLATRGLRPLLVERGDWAQETSSASSRLVHGGLRYLEQFEIGLVRESCLERAWLLDAAAGHVWPERFLFPIRRGDRVGRLKMAAGLYLYTALSVPHALGRPSMLGRRALSEAIPGIERASLVGGGSYLDAATDDARLTLAVVKTAAHHGAVTLSRVEATGVDSAGAAARVGLRDVLSGECFEVDAAAVVLAGGPATDRLRATFDLSGRFISATRGSHVLVPRERLPIDGAVIFPAVDGRAMFLIPWPRYTVIGTTDVDADPDAPVIPTREEVDYLVASANQLVPGAALKVGDVVSAWAGLRPLLASSAAPSARSREERIEVDGRVLTIAGGKLTGFRAMAEHLAPRVIGVVGHGRDGSRSPTRDLRLIGAAPRRQPRPLWPRTIDDDEAGRRARSRRYATDADHVVTFCRADDRRDALDAETRIGEIDWACLHDDVIYPSDFLLRRSDVGYTTREELDRVVPLVVERMRALRGWSPSQVERAQEVTQVELDRRLAWSEPSGYPAGSPA